MSKICCNYKLPLISFVKQIILLHDDNSLKYESMFLVKLIKFFTNLSSTFNGVAQSIKRKTNKICIMDFRITVDLFAWMYEVCETMFRLEMRWKIQKNKACLTRLGLKTGGWTLHSTHTSKIYNGMWMVLEHRHIHSEISYCWEKALYATASAFYYDATSNRI